MNEQVALVVVGALGFFAGALAGVLAGVVMLALERKAASVERAAMLGSMKADTPEGMLAWKEAALAPPPPPPPVPEPPAPAPPWEDDPNYAGKVSIIGQTVYITDDEGTNGIPTLQKIPLSEWMDRWS